jgi:hypothetical protein
MDTFGGVEVELGARDSIVVMALCYKPEGRWFKTDEENDFYHFTQSFWPH